MRIGTLLCLLAVALAMFGGCSKRAQQAAEAARLVADAQDGNFTVKGEDGKVAKVETKGDGTEGTVTVETKEGTISTEYGKEAVKEEDVGVAFYPGAEVGMGSKAAGDKGGYAQVMLTTPDPLDKVAQFYKEKYEQGNTVMQQGDNLMIMIKTGESAGKMIMVSPADGKTQIMITQSTGQ